jgi:polyisoprenoid-binding protein YceI
MENQHVMTSPVTRSAADVIPAAGTNRLASHRPTTSAATRHPFGFTVRDPFGMADGEIHIVDPVRESLARATISAASFRTANPSRDSAVRSARFLAAGAPPTSP